MEKMQPSYQVQAAEIFQLLQAWNKHIPRESLKTVLMSFALRDSVEALNLNVGFEDVGDLSYRCQNTEARIRSRCCGLIEVYRLPLNYNKLGGPSSSTGHSPTTLEVLMNSTIEYLHRTVAEFLSSDDVWASICQKTSDSDFDPATRMTWACLATLKLHHIPTSDEVLQIDLSNLLIFCRSSTKLED